MSFFNNFQRDKFPGRICGNPLNGLCEKVCIQTKKVFDACISQVTQEDETLTVTSFNPANPTYPLTFISAKSSSAEGIITDLEVDTIDEKPKFSRVQCTVTIPMEVLYVDANNVEGVATATLTVVKDVILHIPEASVIQYEIEAVCSAVCPEGTYVSANNFNVDACITVILKVVVPVELLVPSYGYCPIPQCLPFSQEVCATYFDLPLFPGANT